MNIQYIWLRNNGVHCVERRRKKIIKYTVSITYNDELKENK